jgi:cyclic-di-GMP-binding protein
MPSVDVVSRIDVQAIDNAVNNTKREVTSRFDFRNVETEIEFDRKNKSIHLQSGDEGKVRAIVEILTTHGIRMKIDPRCLDIKEIEPTSRGASKLAIHIREGLSQETARKIVKLVKDMKFKVQPAIQGDEVRLTGKKIDELQAIMKALREQEYDLPLQFVNMKA